MMPRPPSARAAPARGRAVPPAPVKGRRTGAGRDAATGAGAGGSVTDPAIARGRSSSTSGVSGAVSGGVSTDGTPGTGGGAVSGGAVTGGGTVSGGDSTGGPVGGGTSGGVPRCAPTAGASSHDPSSTQPMARTSLRNIAPPSSRRNPAAWGWRMLRLRPLTERPTWAGMTPGTPKVPDRPVCPVRRCPDARRRSSGPAAPDVRRTGPAPARPAGSRARRSPRRWSRRGRCSTR